jgi:DNA-binding protein HU-beta
MMNKSDLVDAIATGADLTKAQSARALEELILVITKKLAEGDKIIITGFGTLEQRKRSARTGRNPKTGEPMQIKAAVTVGFKAGKFLKEAVQKSGEK